MAGKLKFRALLGLLKESLVQVPDHRRGRNGHYEIADAGLAACRCQAGVCGIGAGWKEDEYLAYGYEYPRPVVRIRQLAEALQIIRRMWSESPASFQGKYYQIENAYCEPMPEPQIPIMVGAKGEQLSLKVVAQHANWWNADWCDPPTYAHKLDVLQRHCKTVGRGYDAILKTATLGCSIADTGQRAQRMAEEHFFSNLMNIVGTPWQVTGQLKEYVDLGVRYVMVVFADYPDAAGANLFAEGVVPEFE